MPIYEYQCQTCHHELEKLQKMSDDPLVECPECKQPTLRKKISAAGFRLSGSGWYETDFKKGGSKKNLVGSESKAAEGSESKKAAETSSSDSSSKPKTDGQSAKSSAAKE